MKKLDQRGQITVFLTLLFLVLSLVFLCFYDGIRMYLGRGLTEEAMEIAGREVTANYHEVLAGRYHLFALDARERPYITRDGEEYIKEYLGGLTYDCRQLEVKKTVFLLDEEGHNMEGQIIKYMKCKKARDILSHFTKLADYCEENEAQKGTALTQMDGVEEKTVEAPAEEVEENPKIPPEKKEEAKWKTIKELLDQLMQSGILLYVCDDREISDLSIPMQGLPSQESSTNSGGKTGRDFSLTFDNLREIRQELQQDKEDSLSGLKQIAGKTMVLSYINENFRDWCDQEWPSPNALHYEKEYLIAGQSKDRDNLRIVANKILRMRFAENFAYALANPGLSAQAELMGMSLCGLLGFPEVSEAVKYILLAAVSYGESMLDLHSLFAGKKVPLVKDQTSWMTDFENLAEMLRSKTIVREGGINLAYQEYLDIFMGKEILKNTLYLKAADIMQSNIGLQEEGFNMKECIFSYDWQADFSCHMWNVGWIVGESSVSLLRQVSYK